MTALVSLIPVVIGLAAIMAAVRNRPVVKK